MGAAFRLARRLNRRFIMGGMGSSQRSSSSSSHRSSWYSCWRWPRRGAAAERRRRPRPPASPPLPFVSLLDERCCCLLLLLKTIVMNLFRLKTLGQNSIGNVWLSSHLVHNSDLLLNATWTCASSTIQVIDRSVIGWTRYIVVTAQQLLLIEWTTMITIALWWSLMCWLEKSSVRSRMPLGEGGFLRLLLVAGAGPSHYHGWRTEWLNLVRWNRLHWRSMGEISIEVSRDPFVWCRIVGSCFVVEKYRCWLPTRLFCPWMSRETHRWSMALNLVDSVLSLRRLVYQHSP